MGWNKNLILHLFDYFQILIGLEDTHKNLGRDIVNHCVNDMIVKGGNPLMFLDYNGK